MIGVLIREDPALRHLGKWIAISLVTSGLLLNLITFRMWNGAGGPAVQTMSTMFAAFLWIVVTVYLAFGQVSTRCSVFGMTLPLSSRRLWGAHLAAVSIGAFSLLAAAVVAVVVGTLLLSRLTERPVASVADLRVPTIHLAALILLAIVALDTRTPDSRVAGAGRSRPAFTAAVLLAVLPIAVFMMRLPVAVVVVPLLAVVALTAWRLRTLPDAFSLSPERLQAADVTDPAAGAWAPRTRPALSRKLLVDVTVVRSIFRKKAALFLAGPFLLIFGLALSGLDEYILDENLRPLTMAMTAYLLMSFIVDPLLHIHRVDALPVSRRRVFALMVLPGMIVLAIGYGMGRLVIAGPLGPAHAVEAIEFFKAEDGNYHTRVPIEFCELHWGDDVPEATSPWGETSPAWSMPLHKGSPIRIYSPFTVGDGASVDFAALQISRAVNTIFGEPITPEVIKGRYLREQIDGGVALIPESLSLERDFPGLRRRAVGPVFPVVLMLIYVLWFSVLRAYLPVQRAGNSRRKKMTMGFVWMGVLFSLYIAQLGLASMKVMESFASMGLVEILVRRLGDAFPGGAFLVWGACAGIIAVAYLWAERSFLRIESVPAGDDSCAII